VLSPPPSDSASPVLERGLGVFPVVPSLPGAVSGATPDAAIDDRCVPGQTSGSADGRAQLV